MKYFFFFSFLACWVRSSRGVWSPCWKPRPPPARTGWSGSQQIRSEAGGGEVLEWVGVVILPQSQGWTCSWRLSSAPFHTSSESPESPEHNNQQRWIRITKMQYSNLKLKKKFLHNFACLWWLKSQWSISQKSCGYLKGLVNVLAPLPNVIWHIKYVFPVPTLLFILSSTWSGLKLQKLTRMTTFVQKFPEFRINFNGKRNHCLVLEKLTKHFGDHPECPCKGAGEPVFVFVNNYKALDLFDLYLIWMNVHICTFKSSISSNLVSKNIHQLLHKLCVALVLKIFSLD